MFSPSKCRFPPCVFNKSQFLCRSSLFQEAKIDFIYIYIHIIFDTYLSIFHIYVLKLYVRTLFCGQYKIIIVTICWRSVMTLWKYWSFPILYLQNIKNRTKQKKKRGVKQWVSSFAYLTKGLEKKSCLPIPLSIQKDRHASKRWARTVFLHVLNYPKFFAQWNIKIFI